MGLQEGEGKEAWSLLGIKISRWAPFYRTYTLHPQALLGYLLPWGRPHTHTHTHSSLMTELFGLRGEQSWEPHPGLCSSRGALASMAQQVGGRFHCLLEEETGRPLVLPSSPSFVSLLPSAVCTPRKDDHRLPLNQMLSESFLGTYAAACPREE